MSAERPFSIQSTDISAAESIRPANPQKAIDILVGHLNAFDVSQFDSLVEVAGQREKTMLVQATEITTLSHISMANKSKEAVEVIAHLSQSKDHMQRIYGDDAIATFISEAKVDFKGDPFDHQSEIDGHLALQCITLAHLTGNIGFFHMANDLLDRAVSIATDHSSRTLAAFRKSRLAREFSKEKRMEAEYRDAYTAVHMAATSLNQWERVATVNARYTYDAYTEAVSQKSLDKFKEGTRAMVRFLIAGIADPRVLLILPKEWYKEITSQRRYAHWRQTAPNTVAYEALVFQRK